MLGLSQSDEEKLGLDFFDPSDVLKKKMLTLHSHLNFDHHPIKRVISVFRDSLLQFISDKKKSIKLYLEMQQQDSKKFLESQQYSTLLTIVSQEIYTFAKISIKSLILFYQLDTKHAENSEACLYSLMICFLLKNPVYSNIVSILKCVHKEEVTLLEKNIADAQENYDYAF